MTREDNVISEQINDVNDATNRDLNAEDRRNSIINMLNRNGKIKVSELAKMFGISEVRVRSDLTLLEDKGLLERVHGGAINTFRGYLLMSLNERAKAREEEKRKIASETVKKIKSGDSILFNSGTTTLFVAQSMRELKDVVVITNSVSIASEACSNPNLNVILLGGNLNYKYQFLYGDDTVEQLKRYKANKLILSVDGIDAEEGITTYHHMEAEVVRQMIQRASEVIVVADYTKIGRTSLSIVDSIDRVDMLITDNKAQVEELEKIRNRGIQVITV